MKENKEISINIKTCLIKKIILYKIFVYFTSIKLFPLNKNQRKYINFKMIILNEFNNFNNFYYIYLKWMSESLSQVASLQNRL